MLSVSTMALAAMIGSACVPNANQACNVNSCTYDQANCIQAECAANGGQDLNCLLNGLGACLQDGCQNGNVRPAEYPAWEAAEDKSIGFCNKQCYKRKNR